MRTETQAPVDKFAWRDTIYTVGLWRALVYWWQGRKVGYWDIIQMDDSLLPSERRFVLDSLERAKGNPEKVAALYESVGYQEESGG